MHTKVSYVVGLLIISSFIFGCAGLQRADHETKLQLLKERVQAYTTVRDDFDLEAAYEFYKPEYKKAVSRQKYIKTTNVRYRNTEITDIELEPGADQAVVSFSTTRVVMGFTFKDDRQKLNWIWLDGQWFLDVDPMSKTIGQPQ